MIIRFLTFLAVTLGLSQTLAAQQYNIQNVARLDIVSGYPTDKGHMIAARIQLKEGWKTYWRSPDGNGIPPSFDWSGSKNLARVAFHWPEPKVFYESGVRTIGYKNELVLPIAITPIKKGAPITLRGEVLFGVCEDICIPVKAKFALTITGAEANNTALIRAALTKKPRSAKSAGVRRVTCKISPIEDGFKIQATVKMRTALPPATFTIVEFPHPDVWVEQDETVSNGATLVTSANLYAYGDTPLILDRSKITLTLLGGRRAIELRGCPS